jgi:hypothetical protein
MTQKQAAIRNRAEKQMSLSDVVAVAQLATVDLVEILARRNSPAGGGHLPLPDTAITVEIEISSPKAYHGKQASFLATVRCFWTSKDPSTEKYATASVTHRVAYEFSRDIANADPDVIKAFGEELALHHAWPFLRERLRSLSGEMGLPAVVLPLRKLPALTKKPDSDRSDY